MPHKWPLAVEYSGYFIVYGIVSIVSAIARQLFTIRLYKEYN
jgi:hypothetical protein